jgi:hypothetical protein
MYEVLNRRDLDGMLALMDDEVEIESRLTTMAGGYHGHEGMRSRRLPIVRGERGFNARGDAPSSGDAAARHDAADDAGVAPFLADTQPAATRGVGPVILPSSSECIAGARWS